MDHKQRRSLSRLTKDGVISEFRRHMQRRLDAQQRRPIERRPTEREIKESERRWREVQTEIPPDVGNETSSD